MTNSAAYVGRVGGLAVALGIGAVVACSQQVAWADSPDSPSDLGWVGKFVSALRIVVGFVRVFGYCARTLACRAASGVHDR